MLHDISVTPPQLDALYEWAETGGAYPAEILLVREGENIVAGQGDARVRISAAGDTVDHPEPYTGPAATMTPEQIVRYVLSWGRDEGEDGDTVDEDLAVNGWDDRNVDRCAADLGAALAFPAGGGEDEPTGDRIAREARAHLDAARDIDYDPAAEDEDGVPIFSDETRAAALADPRGERDR